MVPTPEQEQHRARRSKEILNDPMVAGALDEIEKAVVDNIANCPVQEVLLQQQLCMLLVINRKFRRVFQSHMETGKLADFELEKKKRVLGIF